MSVIIRYPGGGGIVRISCDTRFNPKACPKIITGGWYSIRRRLYPVHYGTSQPVPASQSLW